MRDEHDFYSTPEPITKALLTKEFKNPCIIHEPACGTGRMSDVLEAHGHRVYSEDLIDRGYGIAHQDFLKQTVRRCDFLVTNPPFNKAEQFIRQAIDLEYRRHAWLLRLAFLEGKGRYERLWSKYPFDIAYVFSARQTLYPGNTTGTGSGSIAFMWCVWGIEARQRVEWI